MFIVGDPHPPSASVALLPFRRQDLLVGRDGALIYAYGMSPPIYVRLVNWSLSSHLCCPGARASNRGIRYNAVREVSTSRAVAQVRRIRCVLYDGIDGSLAGLASMAARLTIFEEAMADGDAPYSST